MTDLGYHIVNVTVFKAVLYSCSHENNLAKMTTVIEDQYVVSTQKGALAFLPNEQCNGRQNCHCCNSDRWRHGRSFTSDP